MRREKTMKYNRTKKRIESIVLSLILATAIMLSPMKGMSIKVRAAVNELYISGTKITGSINDIPAKNGTKTGKASYDASTKTLTLDNYTYEGSGGDTSTTGIGRWIYPTSGGTSFGGLNIVVKGTNRITIKKPNNSTTLDCILFMGNGKLTIKGSGSGASLYLRTDDVAGKIRGIVCDDLDVQDVTLDIKTGSSTNDSATNGIQIFNNGTVSLIDSKVTTESTSNESGSNGIWASKVTLSGGEFTAIGAYNAVYGCTSFKNPMKGVGWTSMNPPTGDAGTEIPISTSGQSTSQWPYKKVHFIAHDHDFTYTSSGATITGTCANTDCPLTDNKVTLTIVKPARTTVDGTESAAATLSGLSDFNSATGISVSESDIKYVGRDGTTYPESATPPTAVGKYTAKITVEGHTATVDYEIGKAKEPAPTEAEARQNLNISYHNETISAKTGYEVSSTDGTLTPVTDISSILNQTTPTVYVRKLPSDDDHVVSDFVAITLTARPAAPTGLTTQSSSQAAAEDGKIIGTTTAMEYSADNGATWKTATATETIVKAGTYLVRIKATDSAPVGRNVSVNVESLQIILNDNQKPTAKTELVATGRPQELVNAPAAHLPTGATEMQYALGDKGSVPTSGWSTDIPTATEEGTYYVWYKAIGDSQHVDSQPAYLEVTISTGEINVEVETKEDVPDTEVEGVDKDLAESLLTAQEKELVNNGQDAVLKLEITNIDNSVSETDKNLTEGKAKEESGNAIIGMYLDLSLFLQVGNEAKRSITTTNGKEITVKSEIPQNLRAPSGVKRTFFIIHVHNGAARVIARATGTLITFKTSEFSTFALAYIDESEDGFVTELKVTQKNGKIKLSWDKCEGAASYEVFATYCGKDFSKKPTKTTKNNLVTIKKLKGKKVDLTKNFKLYVVAYDASGKKIGRSVSAHIAGKDSKKFKNPKEVKLSTKTITLDKGKSSKITASVKMEKGNRIALSDDHTPKLRYVSTNKNVATVSKKGKVKAVGSGECKIYVFARNGLAKAVSVTVN